MWKRLIAAVVALVLAAVGVTLVLRYANQADERALEGLETQDVLVAVSPLAEGTPVEEFGDAVEVRQVPRDYVVEGAVTSLEDLEGNILVSALASGEQLQRARLATPGEVRATGSFELPEEAEDLHQVTVALEKPRALGGNITPGDTVGVFMSFTAEGQSDYVLHDDGTLEYSPQPEGEDSGGAGDTTISTTHLTLHKVLVVRVEGGYVAPPPSEDDEEASAEEAENTVNVTLAVEAGDAERLVYAMEFGTVWLSLEPEGADEDGTGIVVSTIPAEARNVYQ